MLGLSLGLDLGNTDINMNLLARLERVERAVNPPHNDDGDDQPVAVLVDPNFYGNEHRLPDGPPAHQCEAWYGGECPICKQYERR